jgi:hypothetical protein
MNKNKENKISILLIVIAIIVNFINYLLFFTYGHINAFYSAWSFLAFLAGALGVAIFPLGIAVFISILFILPKNHKPKYLYYFSILFLLLSFFFLHISYVQR